MPRKRFPVQWLITIGITFLCCSLLIYYALSHHKNICTESECSTSSKIQAEKLEDEKCRSVCTTKECIAISDSILSHMDLTVDPCDNFYRFSCGNFAAKEQKGGNHSLLMNLKSDLFSIIKDVMETSKESSYSGSAAQKMKFVYDSCMKMGSLEVNAIRSMQDFLKQIGIPNWPFLSSNFTFLNPTLEETLGKLVSYQEQIFVLFEPYVEELHLEWTGVARNFSVFPQYQTYHKESEIGKLREIVTGILLHTGMSFESINSTWDDFMGVERGVFSLFTNNSDESAPCEEDNATRGSFLECSQDKLNENNTICKILDAVVRNGRITSRFSRDRVYISCDNQYYIDGISDLLNSYSHRALAHYMALRVFINNLKHMSFSIRKNLRYHIRRPFERENTLVEMDQWKFCITWLTDFGKFPLGLMFVADVWPKEAQDELDDIVKEYINTTSKFILNQDWIEDEEKTQLSLEVEEEENFINHVMNLFRNKTKINTMYKRFHPSRMNFIRNVMNHKRFRFTSSKVYPEEERLFSGYPPFEVNAYGGDSIYLTFGILLPPVFHYGYPRLFNLGKLGQIIGHEIGHKVYYFLKSSPKLGNTTQQRFNEIEECLIDQYFNFELKNLGKNLQGNMTIYENFPDNMAAKVTEKIAENLLPNMTENMFALPGLPYTPEEFLYISYAQAWCEVRSIEKEEEHYERDNHSPPEFRIIGGLQNSKRFSQVFNCPPTSFMNPTKKCTIFNDA